jgi:hypothetical protein
MTAAREFVNARDAARIAGYPDTPRGLRAWYACAQRNGIQKYQRGRDKRSVVYDRRDVEALMHVETADRFDHMRDLAIRHARGEAVRNGW